jgi:hypothetical protein
MFYLLAAGLRRRAGAAAVLVIAAALLATAATATAARPAQAPDDLAVSPPPPSQPTRANGNTKHTTRLFGVTPAQKAVAVTQLIYPAEGSTGLDDSFPDDRPRGVTLVTPDDPLTAITAVPLVHFPDNAPILYVNRNGIPKVTQDEIRRLKPVGIGRANGLQAFLVGAAANPGVIAGVEQLGLKYQTVTAPDIPSLANRVDQVYGEIANPDLGYPIMSNSATSEGSTIADVLVGSMSDYRFVLPATHWVSHMPTGLLWVTKDSVPQATIDALDRRNGRAQIYVFGGPGVVSSAVMRELNKHGAVSRITEDDEVAFNSPAPNTPLTTALAFSKMWDPVGTMGWNIVSVGHGFTLVRQNDWQGAVGSAILSHLGFHAPLLLTNRGGTLPALLNAYYLAVAPSFRTSPADGPYNMSYMIGDYDTISWRQQTQIDHASGMTNRRVPQQNTGGGYEQPR